jgi:hypothetical protein
MDNVQKHNNFKAYITIANLGLEIFLLDVYLTL